MSVMCLEGGTGSMLQYTPFKPLTISTALISNRHRAMRPSREKTLMKSVNFGRAVKSTLHTL